MKKKSETFLKFIIIEKFIIGIVSVLLAFGIISLVNKDMEVFAQELVKYFNLDMENHYIEAVITRIGMIGNGTIIGASVGIVYYLAKHKELFPTRRKSQTPATTPQASDAGLQTKD